jgi:hypothetical protein
MRAAASPSLLLLCAGIAGAVFAACYEPDLDLDTRPGERGGAPSDPAGTGLPCDVARLLNDSCGQCHNDPPAGGARTALLTYDALLQPGLSDPSITLAEEALARMQDATSPMPPTGLLDAAAVEPFARWVADGMPQATCDETLTPPDNPYDTPLVCTSNKYWTDGDEGDEEMHPGHACIACHLDPDAFGAGDDDDEEEEEEEEDDDLPIYSIAGTVYPTAHEPNDCYGVDDGAIFVHVEDADGVVMTLPTNEAGNFFTEAALRAPYRVKVIRGDQVRAMSELAEHGDCNVCHTQDGTEDAPGRIMAP